MPGAIFTQPLNSLTIPPALNLLRLRRRPRGALLARVRQESGGAAAASRTPRTTHRVQRCDNGTNGRGASHGWVRVKGDPEGAERRTGGRVSDTVELGGDEGGCESSRKTQPRLRRLHPHQPLRPRRTRPGLPAIRTGTCDGAGGREGGRDTQPCIPYHIAKNTFNFTFPEFKMPNIKSKGTIPKRVIRLPKPPLVSELAPSSTSAMLKIQPITTSTKAKSKTDTLSSDPQAATPKYEISRPNGDGLTISIHLSELVGPLSIRLVSDGRRRAAAAHLLRTWQILSGCGATGGD
ncbi:hypothetical protein BC936DRAFT_137668 [Jimgerdemannia flammicorona]|uniref:Uncharacterized protein n=1 Tax=Jimgerdemannia flammicorona TaxID=994334 RepID=A0A433CWW7_9FUNG|nr:hypothetical protein BC936DRAFT_137668 [Jimgerdemannia flammicorona]